MSRKKCKIVGCGTNISSRETGLCHKHNLRFIRNGTTERKSVDRTKKCNHSNCENTQQTFKGYCLTHYKRFIRYGTSELPNKTLERDKKCKYCDKTIGKSGGARGMCNRHYQNEVRHKDPLYADNKRDDVKSNGYYGQVSGKARHRHIMEHHLGRYLERDEVIHHIDLDKTNNLLENLYVCKSNSDHQKCHVQLQHIGAELFKRGIIGFDDGKYFIK